ncbi:MAG: beta-lactamase family protein [Verrucomicrobia bacterium]|nr:beta-lactamase family protein [Cytophagales bacterium]
MKKKILKFIWFICFSTSIFAQQNQQFSPAKNPETVGFSTERLARLDKHLQNLIDQGIAPNAVTFIARKGQIVHHKAFGVSSLEKNLPLKKDDIFRIASQSKAITSVALMMLFEEGKFLLEDPVSKYIPAFANMTVLESFDTNTKQYKTRPAKSQVTVRQLLTHTAGIPYEHPLDVLPEFKMPYFCSLEKETLAEVVQKIAKRPLLHDPGEKFTYGLNTDVVGYLVEVLSGMSLDAFFRKQIFLPIGMKDTYFYLPENKADRLVFLYSKNENNSKLAINPNAAYRNYPISGAKTYFSGGAGLVSTAEDYAKFCQMLLNGGTFNGKRLLSSKTVAMMTRNQIENLEVWNRQDKFGFGFQIVTDKSHYGDNASTGAYMWGGMYCSEYTIDPKEELILLIFTNVQPYAHYEDFVRKFRILVYQALEK